MSWHPEALAPEVRRELGRLGPAGTIGEIALCWAGAVGAAIAANASPARVARDGTLHVATSSSAWAFELAHLEREIADRLREAAGEAAPARIRFALGRVPEAGPSPETSLSRRVPEVEREDLAAGARIAASIEDSELRAFVARAAAASLARVRRDAVDR